MFGIAESALGLLEQDDPTTKALRLRLDKVRRQAYALADHPAPHEHMEERLALKTKAFDLMRTATTAAVVAGGGRAIDLDSRAQRLAREAMFLLVQGQTPEVRRAHLASLSAAY